MDTQQEMSALQEMFEVIKQLTGFTGDIMVQYSSINRYTEQRGVEAILKHIRNGGRADLEMIRESYAAGFEERLKGVGIPYAGFEVTMEEGERQRMYAFRDRDRAMMREVIREMRLPDLMDIAKREPSREMGIEPGR